MLSPVESQIPRTKVLRWVAGVSALVVAIVFAPSLTAEVTRNYPLPEPLLCPSSGIAAEGYTDLKKVRQRHTHTLVDEMEAESTEAMGEAMVREFSAHAFGKTCQGDCDLFFDAFPLFNRRAANRDRSEWLIKWACVERQHEIVNRVSPPGGGGVGAGGGGTPAPQDHSVMPSDPSGTTTHCLKCMELVLSIRDVARELASDEHKARQVRSEMESARARGDSAAADALAQEAGTLSSYIASNLAWLKVLWKKLVDCEKEYCPENATAIVPPPPNRPPGASGGDASGGGASGGASGGTSGGQPGGESGGTPGGQPGGTPQGPSGGSGKGELKTMAPGSPQSSENRSAIPYPDTYWPHGPAIPQGSVTPVTFTALDGTTSINSLYVGRAQSVSFLALDRTPLPQNAIDAKVDKSDDAVRVTLVDAAKIGGIVVAGTNGTVVVFRQARARGLAAPTARGGIAWLAPNPAAQTSRAVTAPITVNNGHVEGTLLAAAGDPSASPARQSVIVGGVPANIVAVHAGEIGIQADGVPEPSAAAVIVETRNAAGQVASASLSAWGYSVSVQPVTHTNDWIPIMVQLYGLGTGDRVQLTFVPGPGQQIAPLQVVLDGGAAPAPAPVAQLSAEHVGTQLFNVTALRLN
jgi:hypothetical protein